MYDQFENRSSTSDTLWTLALVCFGVLAVVGIIVLSALDASGRLS